MQNILHNSNIVGICICNIAVYTRDMDLNNL